MKLANGFQTVTVDGKQYLTSSLRGFSGQIACNDTAAFILHKLRRRTTEEKIVRAVCRAFDAPRSTVESDVADVLEMLRRIGALEE